MSNRDKHTAAIIDWWMSHQRQSEDTLTKEDTVTCWEPWVPAGPEMIYSNFASIKTYSWIGNLNPIFIKNPIVGKWSRICSTTSKGLPWSHLKSVLHGKAFTSIKTQTSLCSWHLNNSLKLRQRPATSSSLSPRLSWMVKVLLRHFFILAAPFITSWAVSAWGGGVVGGRGLMI